MKAEDQSAEREALPPLPAPHHHGGTYESSPFEFYTDYDMRAYARAALSAREAPAREGWQLVPKEPTFEMLDAGHESLKENHNVGTWGECGGFTLNDPEACYRAMLLAAPPQAPTTDPAPPAAKAVEMDAQDLAILEAVRREMDEDDGGNAPGHAHEVPGIWDDDNGEKAGKPCAWCLTWTKLPGESPRQHPWRAGEAKWLTS